MKTTFTIIFLSIFSFPMIFAQNNVEVSGSDAWIGFMNVTNLSGGYEFGSAWGVPDLKSVPSAGANTLTLYPNFNTYANNPGDAYWINPATGKGNKNMEALTFVEPGATFNGQDLTFSGTVQSYTLDSSYSVKFFIKALDPNADFADALGGSKVFDLPTSGTFSVSATGAELPAGLLIQYGFSVTGLNANPAEEAALGNVVLGPGTSSLNDLNSLKMEMSVFPNPAAEILFIKSDAQVQSYRVSTLSGQTVQTGIATKEVDVKNLAPGTYLINVLAKEGNKVMKFVKN